MEEEVSPLPEIDFDKLMKLYGNLTDDEKKTRKDKIHTDWSSVKVEFFGLTTYVVELYVNDMIPLFLFKRFVKMINRVKQFNQVLEEKAEELKSNTDELVLPLPFSPAGPIPFAISHRGEIVQQWKYFSEFILAFEKMVENRIGDEHQKVGNAVWKAYMLLMGEGAYFESKLSSYLLTITKLSNPALFMHSAYVEGGFEEAEEKDDFCTRIKSLRMNEVRIERLKKENQARKESKKIKAEVKTEEKTEEKMEEKKMGEEGVLKRRKKLKLVIPKKKKKEGAFDVVVDEIEMRNVEIAKQHDLLTSFFMESLASEIDKKIQYLALSDCYGCNVDSLTQNDHNVCLMMPSAEKFDLYFSKAVNLVAFISVFKDWNDRVQKEFASPLSKAEMEAYEIADNPLKRFDTVKGSPQELDVLKNYVKSIYPSYN